MTCRAFKKYLVCPRGSDCEENHIIPKGFMLECIFNQNEVILSMLSRMGGKQISIDQSQTAIINYMSTLRDDKNKIHSPNNEGDLNKLNSKIDKIQLEISTLKSSLIEMGCPMIPPLTHVSHTEDNDDVSYKPFCASLRGKNSTSFGLKRAQITKRNRSEYNKTDGDDDTSSSDTFRKIDELDSKGKAVNISYFNVPKGLQEGIDPIQDVPSTCYPASNKVILDEISGLSLSDEENSQMD